MTRRESIDILILGGGPAGCAAALRLTAMRRHVAVVERRGEPGPRRGESLSAGMGNLLDYLGVADVLDGVACIRDLPARVVWERREAEVVAPRGSVVVDRADFDARLLQRVGESGAIVYRPAKPRRIEGEAGAWRVLLTCGNKELDVESRLILDGRGRSGSARTRFRTGLETVAISTQVSSTLLPAEMRLEATSRAWLWGAPLPGGEYRLLAFVDPSTLKQGCGAASLFRELLTESSLFGVTSEFLSPVGTCSATPYLDAEAWRPGVLKIGENALALDPLSSSGVEKSMRLALQAAVAANTVLSAPESAELARDYYESSLLSSAANHLTWTQGFYGRAWPGVDHSFWWNRARQVPIPQGDPSSMASRLRSAHERRHVVQTPPSVAQDEIDLKATLATLLDARVKWSAEIRVLDVSCVVNDLVQLRPAVIHPALERPVAFFAGVELVPLLESPTMVRTIRDLVAGWSVVIPPVTACQIVVWLLRHRLLEPAIR
jgi:flavin-dependent dehydrogenase